MLRAALDVSAWRRSRVVNFRKWVYDALSASHILKCGNESRCYYNNRTPKEISGIVHSCFLLSPVFHNLQLIVWKDGDQTLYVGKERGQGGKLDCKVESFFFNHCFCCFLETHALASDKTQLSGFQSIRACLL